MSCLEITVDDPWFDYIRDREKDIRIHCKGSYEYVDRKISDHALFLDVRAMLSHYPLDKVLPGIKSINEGVAVYRKYYGNKVNNPFVAIHLE